MLSVAMFAIAIFGAFAISSIAQEKFYYHSDVSSSCEDLISTCDRNGMNQCRVDTYTDGEKPVWEDLNCEQPVTHSIAEVLPEL